jgi:ferredoxin
VREEIALPASIARACSAPCEKACRRARHDAAVSVRLLHRIAGEAGLAAGIAPPARKPASGKRTAVVGAGPAGLAAAYFLLLEGHACSILDDREEPGGGLRHGVPEEVLPRAVLDAEIGAIRALGAEFRMKTRLGRDLRLDDLLRTFDAAVLAVGETGPTAAAALGLAHSDRGLSVDAASGMTPIPGVFAAGAAVRPGRLAARSAGEGKAVAASVNLFLREGRPAVPARRFDSRLGPLLDGEMGECLGEADPGPRCEPAGGPAAGYTESEARREAGRCLLCDCRKKEDCRLRRIAEETGAHARRAEGAERRRFQRDLSHPELVYEPGKCVLCGICVRTAREAGEPLGLAFTGRGFRTRVSVPFDEPLSKGLEISATACARACPTGALAMR